MTKKKTSPTPRTATERIFQKLKDEGYVKPKITLEEAMPQFPELVLNLIESLENQRDIAYEEIGAYQDSASMSYGEDT